MNQNQNQPHKKNHTDDKLNCEKILTLTKHKGKIITDEVIEAEIKEEIIEKIRKNSKDESKDSKEKKEMDTEKELHNIKVYENALHDLGDPEALKTKNLEHKETIYNEFEDTTKELELEIKEVKKCQRALHEIERNIEHENVKENLMEINVNLEKLKVEDKENINENINENITTTTTNGNTISSELRG